MKSSILRSTVSSLIVTVLIACSTMCKADDATQSKLSSVCGKNPNEPCWDYAGLGIGKSNTPGTTDKELSATYSTSLGDDAGDSNVAWLMDYGHTPDTHANQDSFDAGFAFYGGFGDSKPRLTQLGLEVLWSGVRANPNSGNSILENGYALAAVYRVNLSFLSESSHPPYELGFRFIHQSLTTESFNTLETELVFLPFCSTKFCYSFSLTAQHSANSSNSAILGFRYNF